MNAAETIQAAIEKLTKLRAETRYHETNGWLAEIQYSSSYPPYPEAEVPITNDALIVTLHRTIDAQISLLRLAAEFSGITPNRFTDAALDLANAILGEVAS